MSCAGLFDDVIIWQSPDYGKEDGEYSFRPRPWMVFVVPEAPIERD